VQFKVLGPLEVTHDGRVVELGAPRQRAVLGFLLLHANQVVPTDRLAEALWPGALPKTAAKTIHVYVSALRKALPGGHDLLATRGPGYVLHVRPGELDLSEFERLVSRARGEAAAARLTTLAEALSLWRGDALADFAYEAFVHPEAARLAELRQNAVEERIEAELELGGGPDLIAELRPLVAERPLQERPRALLMRALYRAGRQSEALEVFREGKSVLDRELGLEPGPELKELERAILRHDSSLAAAAPPPPLFGASLRSIVVVPDDAAAAQGVLPLAAALAAGPTEREIVIVRVVPGSEVGSTTAELQEARDVLVARGAAVRVAAFSSRSPGDDVARLAAQGETDLLLLAGEGDPLRGPYAAAFDSATCDVAALVGSSAEVGNGPVVVPFGAFEHDWAALELGAWAATALGRPLRLIGADEMGSGGRDASRLLADASLVVQHTLGVVSEPLLAQPGAEGIASLADGAGLLVVGLSERWRSEGLGATRAALVQEPPAQTILVRRGVRPGGIAPQTTLTRFTWSIESRI